MRYPFETISVTFLLLMCTSLLGTEPIHSEALRPASGLIVHIDTEKDTFLVREPIWISVEARNVGNIPIRCQFPGDKKFFALKDSQGSTLPWTGYFVSCIPPSVVEPGESVPLSCGRQLGKGRDVLTCFGEYDGHWAVRGSLGPGTYTITAYCWSEAGGATSNEAHFTVISPEGDEQIVCQLLRTSYESETGIEEVAPLVEILEKHPNSVYVPAAIEGLIRNYFMALHEYDKIVPLVDKLVTEYPNSPFVEVSVRLLPSVYAKIGKHSKEDVRMKLNSIIEHHKGTRAENASLAAIETIEKESME